MSVSLMFLPHFVILCEYYTVLQHDGVYLFHVIIKQIIVHGELIIASVLQLII